MGQVIPSNELTIASVRSKTEALTKDLLAVASEEIPLPEEKLIVRDPLPATDLGLTNEYWETGALTANTYNDYVEQELDDKRFLGIMGITNEAADPKSTGLRFLLGPGAGVKTIDVLQFEDIYTLSETTTGYLEEPIIYKGGQVVNIDVYSKADVAAPGEPLVVKALVCEPAGKIVT